MGGQYVIFHFYFLLFMKEGYSLCFTQFFVSGYMVRYVVSTSENLEGF